MPLPPIAVFLHSGEYDRMHQGLSIAAAAVASGRKVDVFFFWWALERLAKDDLDLPAFGTSREDIADRWERTDVPTLRSLLNVVRDSGLGTLSACTGSLHILGLTSSGMEDLVDRWIGWTTILQLTAGVTDRFYL